MSQERELLLRLHAASQKLLLLLEGKEGLLVAFRLQRLPSNKTWKMLEKSEGAEAEVKQLLQEIKDAGVFKL